MKQIKYISYGCCTSLKGNLDNNIYYYSLIDAFRYELNSRFFAEDYIKLNELKVRAYVNKYRS